MISGLPITAWLVSDRRTVPILCQQRGIPRKWVGGPACICGCVRDFVGGSAGEKVKMERWLIADKGFSRRKSTLRAEAPQSRLPGSIASSFIVCFNEAPRPVHTSRGVITYLAPRALHSLTAFNARRRPRGPRAQHKLMSVFGKKKTTKKTREKKSK